MQRHDFYLKTTDDVKMKSHVSILAITVSLMGFMVSGCQGGGNQNPSLGSLLENVSLSSSPGSSSDQSIPQVSGLPGPQAPQSSSSQSQTPSAVRRNPYSIDVLLFAGDGTWSTEVSSLESVIQSHGLTYRKLTSAQLNSMSLQDLTQYGLFLFPGGSGGTQARSLTSQTHALLRSAVQNEGVSYLGFCAGAFIAVAPAPHPGQDVSYGLGIVNGPELDYYYLENQLSPDVAMTLETFADGSQRDLLWYGGPVTPDIPGGVIARYPNGDPAMTELISGQGFVILSGPHPAAPPSVKNSFGLTDTDGSDLDLAWALIQSALDQSPIKAF